ncbi:MAG: hypothetical protein ACJ8EB_08525 [Allosphingosinicella sp.]
MTAPQPIGRTECDWYYGGRCTCFRHPPGPGTGPRGYVEADIYWHQLPLPFPPRFGGAPHRKLQEGTGIHV